MTKFSRPFEYADHLIVEAVWKAVSGAHLDKSEDEQLDIVYAVVSTILPDLFNK